VTQLRKGLGNDAIVRAGTAYRLDVGANAPRRRARAIAAGSTTDQPAAGAHLDDRQALTYMRDVLDELMRGSSA
jgi:hypothetical protein